MQVRQHKWKTLGLSSYSRIWSTVNLHNLQNAHIYKQPLTLSGQTTLTQQHRFKMKSKYTRVFSNLKKILILTLFIFYLPIVLELVANVYSAIFYNLSLCNLTNVYVVLFTVGFFFLIIWIKRLPDNSAWNDVFGLLFCICISSAWKLLRVDNLSTYKYIKSPQRIIYKNNSRLITNSTQVDKLIIRQVYIIFSKLIKLENKTYGELPKINIILKKQTQSALQLNVHCNIQRMYSSLPILNEFPTIEHKLSQNTKNTALALFNWYTTHSNFNLKTQNNSLLWHKHRHFNVTAHLSGLLTLKNNSVFETKSNDKNLTNVTWLVNLQPATTWVIEEFKYPIRYDLIQKNKITQNVLWNNHKRLYKIKLKSVLVWN